MNTPLSELSEQNNQQISGFIQYKLGQVSRPVCMSRSICELLGQPQERLRRKNGYLSCIVSEDRQRYTAFLARMGGDPHRESLQYRVMAARGHSVAVLEQLSSWQEPDGKMIGESVVQVIGNIRKENTPWGILRFSCEKNPRIIYMNSSMKSMLCLPEKQEGETDYLEMYQENIFLLLPMEERRRFARYLEKICTEDVPVFGEAALLRCDGTRVHVFGWVTKGKNGQDENEFQAVCLDITKYFERRKAQAAQRYLNALKDVYDKIFQYDLGEGILKCLYDVKESRFRWLGNIPMQLDEATEKWVNENVIPEQQEEVLSFFMDYCHKKPGSDPGTSNITYRARSSSGEIGTYSGLFLQIENDVSLYCCRRLPDLQEADQLRSENITLKENMQELMMQFTDGIAAFQLEDGKVTPLYITDNICSFFGRTREEWLPMMEKATPVREFVSGSAVDYEKFAALLREGEAEFSYTDLKTHTKQRMKAICSHKTPQNGVPRYVLLYNVQSVRRGQEPHVYIRTFGFFDVFVNENPIAFRNRKSKELFALLVDRRGGYVTSEEAIGYLWEDEPVSPVTLARYRKVALRLKNTLMEYGITEVLEAVDGKRRIIPQKVRCDLYDYLSGGEEYKQLFKGSYLSNYSWGETTLAELTGIPLY